MTLSRPPFDLKHQHSNSSSRKIISNSPNNHNQKRNARLPKQCDTFAAMECSFNNRIQYHLSRQASLIFDTCPSTWHANSERHSPVMSSSHTATKIHNREKYRRLTHNSNTQCGYKGNSKDLQNTNSDHSVDNGHNNKGLQCKSKDHDKKLVFYHDPCICTEANIITANHFLQQPNTDKYLQSPNLTNQAHSYAYIDETSTDFGKTLYNPNSYAFIDPYQNQNTMARSRLQSWHVPMNTNRVYVNPFHPYPPSPPPSPISDHAHVWHQGTTQPWIPAPAGDNMAQFGYHGNTSQSSEDCIQSHRASIDKRQECIRSHRASIKVSMVYDSTIEKQVNGHLNNIQIAQDYPLNNKTSNNSFCNTNHSWAYSYVEPIAIHKRKFMKTEPQASHSCAITQHAVDKRTDLKHYDVEASVHMRIVEAERTSDNCAQGVPVHHNIMDYFN